MQIPLPKEVQSALAALNAAGFAAYAVGGCVRDCLTGKTPKDWDITTAAKPEQTRAALASYPSYDTGLAHGTLTVIADGFPIEITTFRLDGTYSDHRRPDTVSFTSDLRADLSRRDFTVNAMAYHPQSGVLDFFGGTEDLQNKRIRCVGEPDIRFGEDALRILRALRFASVLDFSIEEKTAQSVLQNRALLQKIAAERSGKELLALLCGIRAEAVLTDFAPVIFTLIPQLEATYAFAQNTPYHSYDVWQHSVKALQNVAAVPELRMAMLLHDVAKPLCHKKTPDGRSHFKGHAAMGAAMAMEILKTLRYPNKFCEKVSLLIRQHDQRLYRYPERIPRLLGELGREDFLLLLEVMRADCKAKSPLAQPRLPIFDRIALEAETLLAQKACLKLADLALSGDDLLSLGIPKGKQIGDLLQALLDAVLRGEVANTKEALIKYVRPNK